MKFKVVQGYKGSGEIQIAMERKEVDGICLAYDSLMRGNLARQGQINVLLQAALEPDPRLKDVPLGVAAARTPEEKQALELFFARVEMGRPFVLPPGVPGRAGRGDPQRLCGHVEGQGIPGGGRQAAAAGGCRSPASR